MIAKCLWCGRYGGSVRTEIIRHAGTQDTVQVCSHVCEDKMRRYVVSVMGNLRPLFIRLLVIYAVGLITAVLRVPVDRGGLGCFILFAGSGLTLMQYPFVTPQIIQRLGARRAVMLARILGAANVGIGIFFWWRLTSMSTL